jgi:signal transduction histidine kinase/CheY-like chemotaxis protein
MNSRLRTGSIFDRRSIRYPLVRLIVMVTLLAIGLALVSDAILTLGNVRKDIRRTMTAAANAAGTAASAAVAFNDAKAATEALRMFDAYPEIKAAALYPSEGGRLASYGEDGLLPRNAQAIGPTNLDIPPLTDTATLHLPIVVDETQIGSIYVSARLDSYWRTYLITIATTFSIALSAGALALLLALRFLDRIILPVRQLAEAANDARVRQNFRPREIIAADDEIGDMVRNFNALLEEIDAGRKSLQRQHEELEHLVGERTAELLAAKDSADEANAAKSRFLTAASHDLRQPIHAMGLFLDTLRNSSLNGEQRRIADYLSLSTRNLAEILNALLDISRLDGGAVKPHLVSVPAYDLLHNVEAEFSPLALAKGLRFKFFFPSQELMLFTDVQLLYSLLRNIIDNAIKYTTTGGVLIGFRRRRGSALIQIWDTGVGIASDHLEAIFDEYYQVENPQRDRTKGLGLGLAIAKQVAGILGSRIRCYSRPGKGSKFEIGVPLADAPELLPGDASGKQINGPGAPSLFAGLHVVLIEDDVMAANALKLSLERYGVNVTPYPSAEDALAEAQIENADFYIVDYRLPGLNGIQLLDEIQKRAKGPIKAILLTGETNQGVINTASPRRWKVLYKPIDSAALVAQIEAQINQHGNKSI